MNRSKVSPELQARIKTAAAKIAQGMIDKGTQPHNKGNWHKVNVQGEQIVLRKVPESYAKTPDACPFCAGTGEALPCMPCGNCGGTGRIRKIS